MGFFPESAFSSFWHCKAAFTGRVICILSVKSQQISRQGTPEYCVPKFLCTKGKENKGGTFSYSSKRKQQPPLSDWFLTVPIYPQGISKKNVYLPDLGKPQTQAQCKGA